MSAIALMAVGLGAFTLGYLFYSRFISERVFQLSSDFRTPAHVQEDGVDFVPRQRHDRPTADGRDRSLLGGSLPEQGGDK